MRWLWGLTVAGLMLSNTTRVDAFTFNEAISGDLPESIESSNTFILNPGENTFTGQITFAFSEEPMPVKKLDFDSFAFIIPNETSLESIFVDISLLPGGSGTFDVVRFALNGAISEEITIPSTNVSLFTSLLPLEPGLFALRTNSLFGGLTQGQFQTATYTFSLNVAAAESIPEPSILGGLSILSLGFFIKKKKG
jgi:hypothetical protein